MSYVLHCLPGDINSKAVAFDNLIPLLVPRGVVFGTTILGRGVEQTRLASALMRAYNRKGIFSNLHDDRAGLERCLADRFHRFELRSGAAPRCSPAGRPRAEAGSVVPMSTLPDQEWRVEVNLDDEQHGYSLGERLRAHDLDDEARKRLGGGVIVTREGPRLQVYTNSEAAAREAERVVRELAEAERLTAEISVTVWDEERDAWLDAEGGEVVEDPRAERGGAGVLRARRVRGPGRHSRRSPDDCGRRDGRSRCAAGSCSSAVRRRGGRGSWPSASAAR